MDNIAQNSIISNQHAGSERNVYRVKNERMGGFVPSYDAPKAQPENQNFDNIISSYMPKAEEVEITPHPVEASKKFGFLDLVDMVNPLQHIPLVNMAYRSISGDEIKPIGKILGGAVFGGAVGAASGLVSTVIEDATGKNLLGNAVSLAGLSEEKGGYDFDGEYKSYEDLPASLLAFAEMPMQPAEEIKDDYSRVKIASGRSAGTIAVYS